VSADPRDVALGAAAGGLRAALAAGRVAILPAQLAMRAPVIGNPLQRLARDLAHEGALVRARTRAQLEASAEDFIVNSDLDRLIAAVLDHDVTERALDRALASPGLERLVVQVLESRLVDDLTKRVLDSPEMDAVVQYIATSPEVLDAVSQQTQSLAQEMVADVRRRTQTVDDVAERRVRGWLRRPRPATP
jgi:hypothetical protein